MNEVIEAIDTKRPKIAPLRFFLCLYINAHVVEKSAVDKKSMKNPQNSASPIVIYSISVTTREIPSEYMGPNKSPATVIIASFASKVRNITLMCITNVEATARAQKTAAMQRIFIFIAVFCFEFNLDIKKSPFKIRGDEKYRGMGKESPKTEIYLFTSGL